MARAPKVDNIEWDEAGWDQILTHVVDVWAVPGANTIADVCNEQVEKVSEASLAQELSNPADVSSKSGGKAVEMANRRKRKGKSLSHQGPPDGKRDYMVSVEGSDPLDLKDYRATVITVTNRAKIDNARNNSLVQNLYRAGGA